MSDVVSVCTMLMSCTFYVTDPFGLATAAALERDNACAVWIESWLDEAQLQHDKLQHAVTLVVTCVIFRKR